MAGCENFRFGYPGNFVVSTWTCATLYLVVARDATPPVAGLVRPYKIPPKDESTIGRGNVEFKLEAPAPHATLLSRKHVRVSVGEREVVTL